MWLRIYGCCYINWKIGTHLDVQTDRQAHMSIDRAYLSLYILFMSFHFRELNLCFKRVFQNMFLLFRSSLSLSGAPDCFMLKSMLIDLVPSSEILTWCGTKFTTVCTLVVCKIQIWILARLQILNCVVLCRLDVPNGSVMGWGLLLVSVFIVSALCQIACIHCRMVQHMLMIVNSM